MSVERDGLDVRDARLGLWFASRAGACVDKRLLQQLEAAVEIRPR